MKVFYAICNKTCFLCADGSFTDYPQDAYLYNFEAEARTALNKLHDPETSTYKIVKLCFVFDDCAKYL